MDEATEVTNEKPEVSAIAQVLSSIAAKIKDLEENSLIGEALQGETIEVASVECRPCLRQTCKVGTWVAIRPANETKTYLGVYLGDLSIDVQVIYHKVQKSLALQPLTNPAFFIPGKERLFWGQECWWKPLESPESLADITDADIQDVWYVKAFKDLSSKDPTDA